ncbi:MAG: metal-sulfur cluster assembly factor [Candidatus Magasanikbacteria bacterium]|nr:metal-sulfur cluster assembly factor [Candidatus Magasanikbacteria bacterium]
MINKDQIIERLETVIDPELNIDIYTMGLIYDIQILNEKDVKVIMTFTTPSCPAGPMLIGEVKKEIKVLGFENVEVEITFDPMWKPPAELRAALGI